MFFVRWAEVSALNDPCVHVVCAGCVLEMHKFKSNVGVFLMAGMTPQFCSPLF